jgi:hypothetical protein
MSNYTSGPWHVDHYSGARVFNHEGTVATVPKWNSESESSLAATVRLIAAAPDLLNALQTLADAAESRGIPAEAARDAIAKATS